MVNKVRLSVDGINNDSRQRIIDTIMQLTGIEYVTISENNGEIEVAGMDLDYHQVTDTVESLGYAVLK